MQDILTLYRGDSAESLSNINPVNFNTEGICSKAFGGGGNPQNIEIMSLLKAAKTHVSHLTDEEKAYYAISDFISCTTEREIAEHWAKTRRNMALRPCLKNSEATNIIFEFNLEWRYMSKVCPGIWEYRYACNPKKKYAGDPDTISPLTAILKNQQCPICLSNSRKHSLRVYDAALLFQHLGSKLYDRATKLSKKNVEYLLVPYDIELTPPYKHRSTRIQLADFWNAEMFTMHSF